MKMYSTFSDTRQCILNNKLIIAKVVVKGNRKRKKYPQKFEMKENHVKLMWITIEKSSGKWKDFNRLEIDELRTVLMDFYSSPLITMWHMLTSSLHVGILMI